MTLVAAAGALALGACASTGAGDGRGATADQRDCFRNSAASGYEIVDPSRVRLRAGTEEYILTLRGSTMALDWTSVIGIESQDNLICDGDAQGVYLRAGSQRVAVSDIERVPDTAPTGS